MLNFIKSFRADEDGAVTVDWVVLTAALVGLGIATLSTVTGSVDTISASIETELGTIDAADDSVANAN